jgi:hypothetical protein
MVAPIATVIVVRAATTLVVVVEEDVVEMRPYPREISALAKILS